MASSITVPDIQKIENYLPGAATALVAVATAAKADIDSSSVSGSMITPVATIAALTALDVTAITNGTLCLVLSDNTSQMSLWRYHSTSVATETTKQLVAAPDAGAGAWLNTATEVALSLAVTKDTVDAATIFTVPTGARLRPKAAWWDVGTSWTGGSSAAIGVHASPSGWTTKGDILGGASGDVLATLVSTATRMTGTVGAKLDGSASGNNRLILIAADTLKFDRITDAFTAGAANVRVLCDVLKNAGA